MGGAFRGPGNVTPLAESNFFQDALSADFVIRTFVELDHGSKLTIAPLDVTLQATFTQAQLDSRLVEGVGRWWAREVCPYYIEKYAEITAGAMPLHDVHPLVQMLHPEWYSGVRPSDLRVDAGGGAAHGMLQHDARHWSPPLGIAASSVLVEGAAVSEADSGFETELEAGTDVVTSPLVLTGVDEAAFVEWVLGRLSAV